MTATIVLVHGAFAESSSWNGVVGPLQRAGHTLVGHRFMAERAGSKRTIEIAGASHVVGMSHPDETVELILQAAGTGAGAAG